MDNCLFCRIVRGEIPSRKVFEDDLVYAFHDIHPLRPMHLLVIPKVHITSLADAGAAMLVLELVPAATGFIFPGVEEGLEELRVRLRLAPEPARDAALRAGMAELLAPTPDGGLAPREQQRYAGVVWWAPETNEAGPAS